MSTTTGKSSLLTIIALMQAVMYAVIWLWNEFVAVYITLIFPSMILLILLLAVIADWIEPSRIPRWYYILMIISVIIPVVIGAVFFFIYEGRFDFLSE